MSDDFHTHEANPYYLQAIGEHRELHAAIDRIRHLLEDRAESDATDDSVAEVIQSILAFRERLARHFTQEEEGGYLEEAIAQLPQVASQVDVLQRQHHEFIELADAMLANAGTADIAAIIWSRLKSDYDLFAKRLNAHEAAEDFLLQRAFNEDPGIEL
jgi:hypothetical protein